jgi:predicted DNA-binding transcriptional regulator AlpA
MSNTSSNKVWELERHVHQRASRTRLTIAEICADLAISRSTFYERRIKGRAPRCIKLPNGDIRVSRTEYERWLTTLEEAA